MNDLILKVPNYIFSIIVVAPILYVLVAFFNPTIANISVVSFLAIFVNITIAFWLIAVISFFNSVKQSPLNKWLYPILILILSLNLASLIVDIKWLSLVSGILHTGFAVLMTIKIKEVFYARTVWFLFLEIWIPIIGVLTLTPDIKTWYSEEYLPKSSSK